MAVSFYSIHGWWVHGVASISVGILGIVVNVIMIIVLSTKDFWKIFFNKLVICLTISDIIFLAFSVYESLRLHIINMNYCSYQGFIQLVVYPMRKISMCFSVYMTIILSFERYLAVTRPIQHRNRCYIGASSKKRFLKYISPAFLVSFIIYGIPSFFAFTSMHTWTIVALCRHLLARLPDRALKMNSQLFLGDNE